MLDASARCEIALIFMHVILIIFEGVTFILRFQDFIVILYL